MAFFGVFFFFLQVADNKVTITACEQDHTEEAAQTRRNRRIKEASGLFSRACLGPAESHRPPHCQCVLLIITLFSTSSSPLALLSPPAL